VFFFSFFQRSSFSECVFLPPPSCPLLPHPCLPTSRHYQLIGPDDGLFSSFDLLALFCRHCSNAHIFSPLHNFPASVGQPPLPPAMLKLMLCMSLSLLMSGPPLFVRRCFCEVLAFPSSLKIDGFDSSFCVMRYLAIRVAVTPEGYEILSVSCSGAGSTFPLNSFTVFQIVFFHLFIPCRLILFPDASDARRCPHPSWRRLLHSLRGLSGPVPWITHYSDIFCGALLDRFTISFEE